MGEMTEEFSPQYICRCQKALRERNAPPDGWICEDVVDYGNGCFTCELCGCHDVRYIHVMEHRDYPGLISVGCICAGVMEGDILDAKSREREARLRSRRKENYLKKRWTARDDGQWSLRYKGRAVMIERDSFRGKNFYTIDIDGDKYQWKANRRMETFLSAQHYVFDLIDAEERNERKDSGTKVH